MTPSRLRRLHSDFKLIQAAFTDHPSVELEATEGEPPERYVFELRVTGLVPNPDGTLRRSLRHRAEVFLPAEYPRRAPFCRMLSPVFHPNIDPQKICIGDHWTAAQSLAEMVIQIAQMLCYQSYNVQSPLNAKAAVWATSHVDTLPLTKADLSTRL